jgi:uncharacterized protein
MEKLVGREAEVGKLQEALASDEAELISVIGRRRVGKTFLVKQVYGDFIAFTITGVQNAPLKEQLSNFNYQLGEHGMQGSRPEDWMEAFQRLIELLKDKVKPGGKKPVVFFDELPWLAGKRSGFLRGLSFFWNSWAVDQRIVVVICGSAASWMIRKVVHHTGGLHNRITRRIFLAPFDLRETEAYLKSRKVFLDRYQTVQLYMAMGGIPHYLKEVRAGKSAAQNIAEICFSPNGLLRDEFSKLYPALFANAANHIAIIRAMAGRQLGLSRSQILEGAKIPEGGAAQRVLEELEQSGFIAAFKPFGKKKKDRLYRLTDEYSLFYLQFIEGRAEGPWDTLSQTQAYKSWSGYAFENICMKHLPAIKRALGVSGIYTEASSFFKKGGEAGRGLQVDLLLDRADHVLNLIEIKFHNAPFMMTREYAQHLREKIALLQTYTQTRKQIFLCIVASFGMLPNEHSLGLVQQALTLDDLFD